MKLLLCLLSIATSFLALKASANYGSVLPRQDATCEQPKFNDAVIGNLSHLFVSRPRLGGFGRGRSREREKLSRQYRARLLHRNEFWRRERTSGRDRCCVQSRLCSLYNRMRISHADLAALRLFGRSGTINFTEPLSLVAFETSTLHQLTR